MKNYEQILTKISSLENELKTNKNISFEEQCLILGKITILKWVIEEKM